LRGLKETGNFIAADPYETINVQNYFPGPTLNKYLTDYLLRRHIDQDYLDQLKLQYDSLCTWINNFGLQHNDIAPRNVIRDEKTGELHLIDFGDSTVYADAEAAKEADKRRADLEWERLFLDFKLTHEGFEAEHLKLLERYQYVMRQLGHKATAEKLHRKLIRLQAENIR
jgi:serine/threonine protein kinase